jgi:Skp family chaperone for outer membrane proteins
MVFFDDPALYVRISPPNEFILRGMKRIMSAMPLRIVAALGVVLALGAAAPAADDVPQISTDGAIKVNGPALPGICVLSGRAVFDKSKVGRNVTAQFKAAHDAAQKGVNEQEAKIADDIKTLESGKALLSSEEYKAKLQSLGKRQQDLRSAAATSSQELEDTRKDVLKRISQEVSPFIAAAYKMHNCAILLSREAVMAGNPSMDLTAEVINGLDGKVATMPFVRSKDSQ